MNIEHRFGLCELNLFRPYWRNHVVYTPLDLDGFNLEIPALCSYPNANSQNIDTAYF